jgi:hypothetical protein
MPDFFHIFHNGALTYNLTKAAIKMWGHRHNKRGKIYNLKANFDEK